jgi:hypothetical protein
MAAIFKYGLEWDHGASELEIEMKMIQMGGRFQIGDTWVGNGLFFHYKALEMLLPRRRFGTGGMSCSLRAGWRTGRWWF